MRPTDEQDTVYGLTRAAWRLLAAFDRREARENDELGLSAPQKGVRHYALHGN